MRPRLRLLVMHWLPMAQLTSQLRLQELISSQSFFLLVSFFPIYLLLLYILKMRTREKRKPRSIFVSFSILFITRYWFHHVIVCWRFPQWVIRVYEPKLDDCGIFERHIAIIIGICTLELIWVERLHLN